MSKSVIEVENLSKLYYLGELHLQTNSIRDKVTESLKRLIPNIKKRSSDPMLSALSSKQPSQSDDYIWALKNVSFEVKRGDILGIIGRNGAGKSTLLKILSRITKPTNGNAWINGRVGSLLEVGTGFHPELTGRENIFLNGAILGMRKSEIKNKFDEIVAFAEIEKFLDTPVKRYSSGMYVRLAFAVAAHLEPEILLVDEVLAVGDAAFQKKCLGKMGDVSKEGRTVLFVSHNMAAIQQLCNRAIVVEKGCIVKNEHVQSCVGYYLTEIGKQKNDTTESILHRKRREGFGDQVRVSDCKVIDSSGIENYHLRFGEPFAIEIECMALSDMNSISFVIALDSILGVRIATSMSEESDFFMSIKRNRRVRMQLKIEDLMIKPGQYSITVGIRGIKGGMDHLENACYFEVTSLLYDEKMVPTDKWGIVYVPPNWSVHMVNEDPSGQ